MFTPPTNFQINAASFFCLLMIAAIYESMRYVMLWKKTSVEYEQLQRENIQSQLEGLKNQVNPHFLFNSLNTLVNIIPENPDTAVRFVQKLSKVYRYILEIRDTKMTPLSNELDFLNAYIFLLKERFGENIQVKIDLSTEGVSDWHIVPLSLQILFENAIKHNIISAQKPLNIEVFIENERLIVKNNLQRKNQVQEGTGVGLQNIKNRYRLVSRKEVDIIVTQQSFMVALPLLKGDFTEEQILKSTEIDQI
jgi:LytS/YehU family sensor histidine kinase